MGVFQVRNTVTGQVLIGASTDLPAMLNRLRAQLRLVRTRIRPSENVGLTRKAQRLEDRPAEDRCYAGATVRRRTMGGLGSGARHRENSVGSLTLMG
jgi:hypothetical protein